MNFKAKTQRVQLKKHPGKCGVLNLYLLLLLLVIGEFVVIRYALTSRLLLRFCYFTVLVLSGMLSVHAMVMLPVLLGESSPK